jgi:hypothetical protein
MIEKLRGLRLSRAAELVEAAVEETLNYYAFPEEQRHAMPWFVRRLDMDCDRLLRARLWKLYDEGHLFGRLRGGRGGAIEYMKQLYMQQLEHPDE